MGHGWLSLEWFINIVPGHGWLSPERYTKIVLDDALTALSVSTFQIRQ